MLMKSVWMPASSITASGIDFTYYVRNTKDDIVDAGVFSASGYKGVRINAGKVHNHGVELLLTAVPVKTKRILLGTVH